MTDRDVFKQAMVRLVAYFQMIGGLIGLMSYLVSFFILLHKVFMTEHLTATMLAVTFFLPLLFMFLFLLMLRAGMLLSRLDVRGYRISLLLQALQVPVIILGNFSYNFYSGAQLAVGYITTPIMSGWQFRHQLGSYYWLHFTSEYNLHGFFINLVALLCVCLLIYGWPRSES